MSLDFLHHTPRGEMRAVPTPTSTCRRAVAHFVRVCFGAQPLPRLAPAEKRSDHAMSTRALWYFFVLGLMWATKEESCFVLGGNGAYPGMCGRRRQRLDSLHYPDDCKTAIEFESQALSSIARGCSAKRPDHSTLHHAPWAVGLSHPIQSLVPHALELSLVEGERGEGVLTVTGTSSGGARSRTGHHSSGILHCDPACEYVRHRHSAHGESRTCTRHRRFVWPRQARRMHKLRRTAVN